ncbi:MAG: hypothetical protein C4346_01405 [Chloroflexota bacterium]
MAWHTNLWAWLRRARHNSEHDGQALVEYSLIFVLCIIVCLSILNVLGNNIYDNYWRLIQAMP